MTSLRIVSDHLQEEKKTHSSLSNIKYIIAIGAGKGGVGKSSVTVLLAHALKKKGYKIGVLDADVYGPSLLQMLPLTQKPESDPECPTLFLPGKSNDILVMSTAHFRSQAAIVRAPIANEMIELFLEGVNWGSLDVLLIDFPPGTGDIHLTLMQKAPLSAAIVVTTPQQVALLDVRKAIELFETMHIPLLGIIENMSFFIDPHQKQKHYLFGQGGGAKLASEKNTALLGEIPIDSLISKVADEGKNLFEVAPSSEGALAFDRIAQKIVDKLERVSNEDLFSLVRKTLKGDSLEIWIEGNWKSLCMTLVQNHCPCISCQNKEKKREDVSLLEFSFVGRYALKMKFSKGCSRGIYPFSLLKNLASL